MAKPLEITRIDLLVHPFYNLVQGDSYKKEESKFLFGLWKKHIDEIAKDPARLLFVSPAYEGSRVRTLLHYANKKLGDRFATFNDIDEIFKDGNEKEFKGIDAFAKAKKFKIGSEKVKTRGFGEYTNKCVTTFLIALNKAIKLKNPVPYRNKQSTLLPRKSVSIDGKGYPKTLNRTMLLATKEGREKLREMIQEHGNRRRKRANQESQGKGFKDFKPRTKLMKLNKKRRP